MGGFRGYLGGRILRPASKHGGGSQYWYLAVKRQKHHKYHQTPASVGVHPFRYNWQDLPNLTLALCGASFFGPTQGRRGDLVPRGRPSSPGEEDIRLWGGQTEYGASFLLYADRLSQKL